MGLTGLGLPPAIVVALRGETRVVGLLAVERDESFSLRERRVLETVGVHAGSALESGQTARALAAVTELKERLAHEARHDPLTGLANRSLFSLRVEAALARDDNAPAVHVPRPRRLQERQRHARPCRRRRAARDRRRAAARIAARGGPGRAPGRRRVRRAARACADDGRGGAGGGAGARARCSRRSTSTGAPCACARASASRSRAGARLGRRAAAQRRPRDVRRQGRRAVALRDLLARDARRGAGAPRARRRSPRGHLAGPHPAVLPAARRSRQRPQLGRGGARALAPSAARRAAARALHRARRGDGPDNELGRGMLRAACRQAALWRERSRRRGARRRRQRLAPQLEDPQFAASWPRRWSARTCRRRRSCSS